MSMNRGGEKRADKGERKRGPHAHVKCYNGGLGRGSAEGRRERRREARNVAECA